MPVVWKEPFSHPFKAERMLVQAVPGEFRKGLSDGKTCRGKNGSNLEVFVQLSCCDEILQSKCLGQQFGGWEVQDSGV